MSKTVLHFRLDAPQYSSEFMRRGFIEAGYEYHGINWQQVKFNEGILGFQARTIQAAKEIQPDLIFMQIQNPGVIDIETCQELSAIGFTVLFNFDVREDIAWIKDLEPYLDMVLMADEESVRYLGEGKNHVLQSSCDMEMYKPIHKINYWLDGSDKTIYGYDENGLWKLCDNIEKDSLSCVPISKTEEKEYYNADICFIGCNYVNTNLNFPLADERLQMVSELKKEYGERFLYKGMNWETSEYIAPAKEQEIYNHSKIAINHNNFYRENYSSDRIWRIMASGCFCLTKYFPGIEQMFAKGHHLDWWKTIEELKDKLDYYLANDIIRERIAKEGSEFVRNNHNWERRVKEIETLMEISKSYGTKSTEQTMP